jgi:SP family facilitated glucose transporter-like MFS transporter 8
LVSKGKEEEAEKSLRFLRGADYNVGAELHDLLQTSGPSYSLDDEEEFGDSKEAVVKSNTKMNNWSFLFSKALRPLLLGISLQLLQQWSGINAIMFHTSELFVPSTAKSLTPDQQTAALHGAILVNVVQVVMCGVTVLSMNRAGRRFFLILSHIGMGLAGSLMGFAFLWDWSTAARMAIIMAYLAFFSLGVGPIPWLVCSEIYPSQVRELAMSLSTLVNWSSAFAVTAAQAPIRSLVGDQGVFWFFSIVSFFGALLVYLTLPETKDKSLEEIEAYFLGGDEED